MTVKKRYIAVSAALLAMTILNLTCGGTYGDREYGTSISADDYPGQSAVVLLSRKVHTLDVYLDLVKTYHYEVVEKTEIEQISRIKILTENGFKSFGDFESDTYNKDLHDYEIKAAVISPTGKRQDLGDEDIKRIDVGKGYFRYRVAFPGLEIGSVIEIVQKIKGDYPLLSGRWDFASDVPTVKSEFVFKVPKGSHIVFIMTPGREMESVVPTEVRSDEIYTMTKENIPPYKKEVLMSPNHIGNPTLHYYVRMIPNWALERKLDIPEGSLSGEPYKMVWDNVREVYVRYFNSKTWEDTKKSGEYRRELDDIISEYKRKEFEITEEHLTGLLAWFREEFQPIDDELFYFRRNPEECIALREGGPFELAYILNYVLLGLDVKPNIILVRELTEGLFDKRRPTYSAFNHPLLCVEHEGTEYWIDPYSSYCGLNQLPWECCGVEGMFLLPTGEHSFIEVPLKQSAVNCLTNKEEVKIDEQGNLTGVAEITLTGQYLLELRKRAVITGEESCEEELKTLLKAEFPETFDEKSLRIDEEGDNRLQATFEYSIPHFADVSENFMNVDFMFWVASSLADVFKSNAREYDIHFPFLKREHALVRIEVPESFEIKELPSNKILKNINFSYERTVRLEEGTVTFERTMAVKSPIIQVRKYEEMKQYINEVYNLDRETMLLERRI